MLTLLSDKDTADDDASGGSPLECLVGIQLYQTWDTPVS
jgi:hypothetical protein